VIHVKDVYQEVEIPLGIRGFDKAIFNRLEGQLHPGYMIQYLKEKFISMGGEIYTGIHLGHLEEQDDRVALHSRLSIPMEVKKVIVTTNAFARQLIPELEVNGARNHVLVTTPMPGLGWKGCFHFDKGFYYFRNIGDRILLGGARNRDLETENTNEFGYNPVIMEALERFLHHHLSSGDAYKIEFQWSGIIGIGSQKSPIIKQLSPRVFAGVRLSGMGIALASLIGEELAEMALQQE
jgi:glycine/D-amino acid oxidase-like deaminating enzyme